MQGLSDDGSPAGEAITAGPSSLPRVSLASDGDRIYVGRLASVAEGTEVWVDALEGGDASASIIAELTMSKPSAMRGFSCRY